MKKNHKFGKDVNVAIIVFIVPFFFFLGILESGYYSLMNSCPCSQRTPLLLLSFGIKWQTNFISMAWIVIHIASTYLNHPHRT